MNLIKLTSNYKDLPVYVNPNKITTIYPQDNKHTTIFFGQDNSCTVQESLEDVIQLLKEAYEQRS